jgi:23S rRNA pseudouridine1911/1915/1917 synthase
VIRYDPTMQVLDRHEVGPDAEPERLDRVAHRAFAAFASRSAARKAVKRGEVLLDGVLEPSSRWVNPGQVVTLVESSLPLPPVYPLSELGVPYEDDHLAIVEKPPGLRVNGARYRTLENALSPHLRPSTRPDALRFPRPAHRLDGPTGGLVAIAKTGSALAGLSEAFHKRVVTKRYAAIVIGRLEGEGRVTTPIEERSADTHWAAVAHARSLKPDWVTRVELFPHTGRTHQLRRHMAGLGHPILGDTLYFREGQVLRGKGVFLWAVALQLTHPITGEPLHVRIDAPVKFDTFMAREQRRWDRWQAKEGLSSP